MDNLFIALFEILSFGAIVVLVVLGLGIIASMMGIFNFAQGEFVLLGAYVTYAVHNAGLPVWLGMLAAPFAVGALGFVLERLIVRRFYAAPIVAMLGTYALGLVIRESVRGLIGGLYISVPEPIGGSLNIGAMTGDALILFAAIVVIAAGGKLVPAYAVSRLTGLDPRTAVTVAVLVNTRGLTELIALNTGLQDGLISQRLFTILVLMALLTTLMTGVLLPLIRPVRAVRSGPAADDHVIQKSSENPEIVP